MVGQPALVAMLELLHEDPNIPSMLQTLHLFSWVLNEKQMETLEKFMRTFYLVWPGGQAWGHVDTDRKGKVDPGFDVPDFVKVKFGKQNVSSSGQERPKSAAEIQGLLT